MERLSGIERMLNDIQREVDYTRHMIGKSALDERVMAAMRAVPRDLFVPKTMRGLAFENGPLAIGHGQTISQPYIVALMTDLLDPEPGDIVLEIGTGSGYQAAVLAQVVKRVYSIEIIPELAYAAAHRFEDLDYSNIEVKASDGFYGWSEHAPFDGIIVTAASPDIPEPLVEQLKPGAKLVIPVGPAYGHQELLTVTKQPDGHVETKDILGVAFVPLTRKKPAEKENGPN
jgi:protein-L-isoaspartate(D-aspartate) O-methyltransferase